MEVKNKYSSCGPPLMPRGPFENPLHRQCFRKEKTSDCLQLKKNLIKKQNST